MNKGTRVERHRDGAQPAGAPRTSASDSSSSSATSARSSTTSWPRAHLIESAQPDDIGVSVSYPLPGTKFYEIVKEQLRRQAHWQESNDLEMMFDGTYTSDFYRAVRDLLHEQVATSRLGAPSCASRWQRPAIAASEEVLLPASSLHRIGPLDRPAPRLDAWPTSCSHTATSSPTTRRSGRS